MGLTNKIVAQSEVLGGFLLSEVESTFDSSYLEGGESFKPSDAGLQSLYHVFCNMKMGTEVSEKWVGDPWYGSEKLHLNDHKTGKEVASAVNCEKVKIVSLCLGRGRAK